METHDELKERVRREQWLAARLPLATERLEGAQQERIWAIVETHQSGLSIRQIASATGLSPSRVHQLLGSDEAREIPRWLSQQRGRDHSDHIRAGLNEPGPNPLVETFRPSSPDCAFCVERRTRLLRGGIRVKRSDSKLWDCGMHRRPEASGLCGDTKRPRQARPYRLAPLALEPLAAHARRGGFQGVPCH